MANAISTATRFHITRASYLFAGPGSPANRKYNLLDFEGIDAGGPDVGAPLSVYANLSLGTPAAVSTTYVVNVAGAGITAGNPVPLSVTNAQTLAKFAQFTSYLGAGQVVVMDVPRNLTLVSSSASDTGTVLVTGFDQYNQLTTQLVTLNGTGAVATLKAFGYVLSISPVSATLVGNLSVGSGPALQLPVAIDPGSWENSVQVTSGGTVTADAGTLVYAVRTIPNTNVIGDVYGTYTVAGTMNGTNTFYVRAFPSMGPNGKASATYGVAAV